MDRTDAASTFVPSWFQPSELGADTPGDAHAQSFSRLWTAFMQARVLVAVVLLGVVTSLPTMMGKSKASKSAKELFAKNAGINGLAAARVVLFGARDVWFVVALPVFLAEVLGWPHAQVGGFMALWIIGYGGVQALAPAITGLRRGPVPDGRAAFGWALPLAVLAAGMAAALWAGDWERARKAIDAMPETLRSQNRWKYWSARVADQLGVGRLQGIGLDDVAGDHSLAHGVGAPVTALAVEPGAHVDTDTVDVATVAGAEVAVIFGLAGDFHFQAEVLAFSHRSQCRARPDQREGEANTGLHEWIQLHNFSSPSSSCRACSSATSWWCRRAC